MNTWLGYGRQAQKERERKRPAAVCPSLKRYLPPKSRVQTAIMARKLVWLVSDTSPGGIRYTARQSVRQQIRQLLIVCLSVQAPCPLTVACSRRAIHVVVQNAEDLESCRLQTGRGCTPVDVGDILSSNVFWRVLQGFADSNGSPEILWS